MVKKVTKLKKQKSVKKYGGVSGSGTTSNGSGEISRSSDFDKTALQALRYQIGGKNTAERNLFLKADLTNPCAVTVANIPMYLETDTVGQILAQSFNMQSENIKVSRKTNEKAAQRESYYTVSASFDDDYVVEKVLKLCSSLPTLCLAECGFSLAAYESSGFCDEYRKNYKAVEELQDDIDVYIKSQDQKIIDEKQIAKQKRNAPDEEGWITVTRSRYKRLPAAVVVKNKDVPFKSLPKKSDRIPFYSFQMKESKAKHLEELRKRFEEDKKKLAIAKAARKFRPD